MSNIPWEILKRILARLGIEAAGKCLAEHDRYEEWRNWPRNANGQPLIPGTVDRLYPGQAPNIRSGSPMSPHDAERNGLRLEDKPDCPSCPDFLGLCDPASPLILDLDGDGVEAGGVAVFDHGGDGWAELSRWAGADDGVLVWDENGDGVINDGSELFGNNSVLDNGRNAAHGFSALAEFDGNGDGVVDSKDAGRDTNGDGVVDGKDKNWENLRVMRWTDFNNNGIKESGGESSARAQKRRRLIIKQQCHSRGKRSGCHSGSEFFLKRHRKKTHQNNNAHIVT